MKALGVDAGSRAIKAVVLDPTTGEVLGRACCDQGGDQEARAADLMQGMLRKSRMARGDVGRIVATGYGRAALEFADAAVTEITCHARGVRQTAPETRTVIDIGGQDSKAIWLDARGAVYDFSMNDRCAAGTGRFLEVVAARLEASVADLGMLAASAERPAPISSTCVVFAETEIVGLLAGRTPRADIAAGVLVSIASRMSAMIGRRATQPVRLTGGVARVAGMADALGFALGVPVEVAPDPEYTGALGAAWLAAESMAAAGDGGGEG